MQNTYDTYLTALNQANSGTSHTQPATQAGLATVKDNLSASMYAKAAAVTQATPFSCTAQYVASGYTTSLYSSNNTQTVVSLVISNGSGVQISGMKVTVDMPSFKVAAVKLSELDGDVELLLRLM